MKKYLFLLIASLLTASLAAQTTKEEVLDNLDKAGGVYYAYPVTTSLNTAPPKGYKPFYISHYGRHGSRYLINEKDYRWVWNLLSDARDANALTEYGLDVLARLDTIMEEAAGHNGDLTALGAQQHKQIAERMYNAFPEVFAGEASVSARSTLVPRCILSMAAFSEALKGKNPKMDIYRESSDKYMPYLCHHYPETGKYNDDPRNWKESYRKFKDAHTQPDRLMEALFADQDFVDKNVNPKDLMWGLYWITVDLQNMDTDIRMYDVFTPDELFDLYQCNNYHFYAADANHANNNGLMLSNAAPLLDNIITSAEAAINGTGKAADLRFGHDGNIIPLAGLMQFKDCYTSIAEADSIYRVFSDFKIAPMAANMQMILFRNPKQPDDVIVKFMLNERETSIPVETDIFPFYHWNDVKAFYEPIIRKNLR